MITFSNNNTPVQEFYTNECLFITGATGFIGKVLLEKLLRSCQGIKRIYVMVRVIERYHTLLKSKIFDDIRLTNPKCLSKIIPIEGNLTSDQLGISEDNLRAIYENVSIVFHCAATVRFDEPAKTALETNLLGTKRLLDLFKRMKRQKAFLYLSTAYSNSHLSEIQERIYTTKVSGDDALKALLSLKEDALERLAESVSEGRVNNYTLSKALCENYLMEDAKDLPLTIVRPSVVCCSWREPYEGWVDSANAFTGVLSKIRLGAIRVLRMGKDTVADLVPVDALVNLMIVAPFDTRQNKSPKRSGVEEGPKSIPVYHCASGDVNPVTWTRANELGVKGMRKYPSKHALTVPSLLMTYNFLFHYLANFYYHFLPALSQDVLLWLRGKPLKFVKGYKRYVPLLALMEEFSVRTWIFQTTNTRKLYKTLSDDDQKIFNFDLSELNWEEYLDTYIRGIAKFTYPETESDLKIGRTKMQRFRLEQVAFVFSVLISVCLVMSIGIPLWL